MGAYSRAKGPPCLGRERFPCGSEHGFTRIGLSCAIFLLERVDQRLCRASARCVVTGGKCVKSWSSAVAHLPFMMLDLGRSTISCWRLCEMSRDEMVEEVQKGESYHCLPLPEVVSKSAWDKK
jgi:hypothetical protein